MKYLLLLCLGLIISCSTEVRKQVEAAPPMTKYPVAPNQNQAELIIIEEYEKDGWHLVRQKGSHRQYKHKVKKGLVTVAVHRMSDDIAKGTLNNILKQAQITI